MNGKALKLAVTIGIFSVGCYLGYLFDSWLVGIILEQIPQSAGEWMGIIKIALWVTVVCFTGGLIITVSGILASLFNSVTK